MRSALEWIRPVMAVMTLAAGVVLSVPVGSATSLAGSAFPVGSFETHLDGFHGVGPSKVRLTAAGAGRNGSRAMLVRTTVRGAAATRSGRTFVATHPAGAAYVVSAWVRVPTARPVALQVREVSGGAVVRVREVRPRIPARRWTKVSANVVTSRADSSLAFGLRSRLRPVEGYRVDDLRVARRSTEPAAEPATGLLTNGCGYTPRGIPSCGAFVGAAHGSNSDPTSLESTLGGQLGVRRTYYTASGVAKAVTNASADLAAGRLPWVSFKLPYGWADMAAGAGDAWARDLARRLAALPGPVWVAFHHEPEGDGDIQQWRKMQEHLAPLVRGAAPNVAFTVVVTGWNQFYGDPKYSLSQIWPRGVTIDVAGFDIYQQYGVVKNGTTTTKWTDFGKYFTLISSWARTANVHWGLAETGVTSAAVKARPTIIADTVRQMVSYGGIGYSYFDTTLNSVADWSLSTTAKVDGFGKALAGSGKLR